VDLRKFAFKNGCKFGHFQANSILVTVAMATLIEGFASLVREGKDTQ